MKLTGLAPEFALRGWFRWVSFWKGLRCCGRWVSLDIPWMILISSGTPFQRYVFKKGDPTGSRWDEGYQDLQRGLSLLKSHQNSIGKDQIEQPPFFKGYVAVKLRGVVYIYISVQHVNMWKCKGGYEVDSQDIVSSTRSMFTITNQWDSSLATYAILIMPKAMIVRTSWLLQTICQSLLGFIQS